MSRENVVLFEGRRAMARRGSPDKALSSFDLQCPDCGAPLSLEIGCVAPREASCKNCGTAIDLGTVKSRTAGARPGD